MTPKRPPRVRGLIVALVAVLVLMGYAFWRAAAGPRAADEARANQMATEPPALPATAAGNPPGAAGSAGDASAIASDAGGQPEASPSAKRPSPAPTTPRELTEAQLMTRLRAIKQSDPAGAVTLAREGNRRFPDSADAPERASILIHALVAQEKGSEARGEAEQMVNHYPDSSWVRDIEHFTGAHRHRAVGVNDAGQLIFR